MQRYADGDGRAFSALYDALAPRLRSFVVSLTGSAQAADDVIQQTMLQIHVCRGRFVRGAPVLPWAYAIAHNLVRDLGRRRGREADAAVAPPGPSPQASTELPPDAALDEKRRERALAQALEQLPEKLRVAFVLVNVEGLPVAEAAAALGVTRGNVKLRAFRARRLLIEADARREGDDRPVARSPIPIAPGKPPPVPPQSCPSSSPAKTSASTEARDADSAAVARHRANRLRS